MGLYDGIEKAARRVMTLFFIADTSGSMTGSKIGAVNQAIEDVIPEIAEISDRNPDSEIKIAAMQFDNDVNWITPIPMEASNLQWSFLQAGGLTSFGAACSELNKKLSRNEFMNEITGSYAPAIFLLSDGEPTDDYVHELEKLKQNKWFHNAIKVAVAIGDDANLDVLASFTGTSEAVLQVHTPEALKRMIRFVSITSSMIGSQSSGAGGNKIDLTELKQDVVVGQLQMNSDAIIGDDNKEQW